MAAATNLVFLPWVRRGMAAAIVRPDLPPSGAAQPVTDFGVTVHTPAGDANLTLPLVGPGDIAGVDSRVIVRTNPGKDESDAEFKHFVSIEFDQADLPWRYTPAAANASGQLHPWLALVVLEDAEWTPVPPSPSQKLAAASVTNVQALPPLDTSWASAHVQLHGAAETATTSAALGPILKGQPGLFVARLVCPRVLREQTRYTALLVPAYKRGVLAGLGQPLDATTDALAPGWLTTDPAPVTLPIYYQWSFQTGAVGDFKDLAQALVPQPVPATVGRRDLDVSKPGFDLPDAAPAPIPPATVSTSMPMQGALQSFQASQIAPVSPSTNWLSSIENFVNTATTSVNNQSQPLVAPPLYGRWHAGQTALGSADQPWLFQLNSDPTRRVSAGLGTLVVEERHQELLASAWSQIEGLLEANGERKVLQLGREAFTRLLSRHFPTTGVSIDSFLLSLGILQRWVLRTGGDITIHAAFGGSVVGRGVFDPQWRRLVRPRGPIGRRQLRHLPGGALFSPGPVTKLAGGFQPAPSPPPTPTGLITPPAIFRGVVPGNLTTGEVTILVSQGNDVMLFWGILLFCVARKLLVAGAGRAWWWLLRLIRFALELIRLATGTTSTTIRIAVRDGTLTGTQVTGAAQTSGFKAATTIPTTIPPPPAPTGTDSADAAAFRQAYSAMLNAYGAPGVTFIAPFAIDVAGTATVLLSGLAPSVTLVASTLSRLTLGSTVNWQPADPIEPVQAAPIFSQPMWAPLRDESVDWILPGLDQVATNSVGLVVSNQPFIEAYMVGLNHEMARTLLWNGYPTDQRGTYFRQFWDSRAAVSGDQRDIKAITDWAQTASLGDNTSRATPPALVLLVRGDLIRRYPNTVVYAMPTPAVEPPDSSLPQTLPIFAGQLTRDVSFYGFPISKDAALTSPGYVFVLQEQPAEPRFAGPEATTPVNPTSPTFVSPGAAGASTAAQFAANTFQHPVRVVIPGSLLVPSS
jgi:hypothetical protein